MSHSDFNFLQAAVSVLTLTVIQYTITANLLPLVESHPITALVVNYITTGTTVDQTLAAHVRGVVECKNVTAFVVLHRSLTHVDGAKATLKLAVVKGYSATAFVVFSFRTFWSWSDDSIAAHGNFIVERCALTVLDGWKNGPVIKFHFEGLHDCLDYMIA